MKSKETGAFAIDALIGLTFFMVSIVAIMFLSLIIKVQANMQYAIGQTAKEISGYYYLLDKIGLASITAGTVNDETKGNLDKLDSTLSSIATLSNDVKYTAEDFKDVQNNLSVDTVTKFANDITGMKTEAENLGNTLKNTTKQSAVDQLKSVLQLFGKSLLNKSFSYYVAPYVCQALAPKYLTSGDVEDYCESVGINWNGVKGVDQEYVDFSNSQLLLDGRSIKIDVEYTINTEKLTFGMVKQILTFHQVATTAAWIRPEDGSSKKGLSDLSVPAEITEAVTEAATEGTT